MRFEKLNEERQIAFLEKLHFTLNKHLFNGELDTIKIAIDNFTNPDVNGMYRKEIVCQIVGTDKEITLPPEIYISVDFIQWIATAKTQCLQVRALATTMLHEMIHQYCDINKIDDNNHSVQFQEIAAAHGLHSVYQNGEQIEQWLERFPTFIADTIKIR